METSREEIVRLGTDDMPAVAELEALCFTTPWHTDQLRAALATSHFIVYGLKRQGVLISYVSLGVTPGELEVLNLATRPEARRQGWGRRLLVTALREAKAADESQMTILDKTDTPRPPDPRRVLLEVRESNVPARALYESLGFAQVGVRRAYYQNNGEDALVMARDDMVSK